MVPASAGGGASSPSSSRRVVSSSEAVVDLTREIPVIVTNISTSQLVDGLRYSHLLLQESRFGRAIILRS